MSVTCSVRYTSSMSEKLPLTHPDRLKWFRNLQYAGAAALAGAGVYIPAFQEVLFFAAGTNVAQGLGAEALRQRKLKKQAISEPQAA